MHSAARSLSLTTLAVTLLIASASWDHRQAEAVTGPVDLVYVTVGTNYADALVGGVLAALNLAPILTVTTNEIPQVTSDALASLRPTKITILGGAAAVSLAVEDALGAYTVPVTGNVDRIQGEDRYETAAKIAAALPAKVKDADRLDGFDHAALRYVSLPVGAFVPSSGATASVIVDLPDSGDPAAGVGLVVPPDRMPGDPLTLYTLLNSPGAPCDVVLELRSSRVLLGNDWIPLTWSSPDQDADAAITLAASDEVVPVTFVVENPEVVAPGMALQFELVRHADATADTCAYWVGSLGSELRY